MDRTAMKERFSACFGSEGELHFFSAPGRTEIGGNHTDHQHGKVLAAAINLEMLAAVAENGTRKIRLMSEGFDLTEVDLDDLGKKEEEVNTTASLIRGIAAYYSGMAEGIRGGNIDRKLRGIDVYVTSTVLPGSGLSSSAAFEVLVGTILNHLFNSVGSSAVEVAQIGQWAENNYFGKPCGLMDQTASSVGNIITIDFNDPTVPVVERIDFDFASAGHALCIIDSHASHADLTHEYASIPYEMKDVSHVFGKEFLRDVDEQEFYARLPEVRAAAGDRATLRAIHIFEDNRRVSLQVEALRTGDFDTFLALVRESGLSSWRFLQNVAPTGSTRCQEVAFSLALAERLLKGRGACRVHGGGFAGTIQAFVPLDMLEEFRSGMDAVLGEGSCHVLSIRAEGGVKLEG